MKSALRASRAAFLVAVAVLVGAACSRGPSASRAYTAPTPASAAPATPTPSPRYEARIGREVYHHYCQTCHGENGAGDGFNAFNLDPHPRDFSDPAFQKKTDADIRDAIRRGGAGVGLSPLMPPWGHTLNDRQIGDVILYLRTLQRPLS